MLKSFSGWRKGLGFLMFYGQMVSVQQVDLDRSAKFLGQQEIWQEVWSCSVLIWLVVVGIASTGPSVY